MTAPAHHSATALVADDERLARRRILELLDGRDAIRVAGECASGTATLAAVRRLDPDLLFLDGVVRV